MSVIYEQDTFVRSNQSGWGTASDGSSYTAIGAGTPSIASDEGVLVSQSNDTNMRLGTTTATTVDLTCRIAFASTSDIGGIEGRFSGTTLATISCYKLLFYTGNLNINKAVSGTNTHLAAATITITAGSYYHLHFLISGNTLSGNMWADGTSEPSGWMVTAIDSSITTAGGFALLANTSTGSAGISFDHVVAQAPTTTQHLSTRTRLMAIKEQGDTLRIRLKALSTKAFATRLILSTVHSLTLGIRLLFGLPYRPLLSRLKLLALLAHPLVGRMRLLAQHTAALLARVRLSVLQAHLWLSRLRLLSSIAHPLMVRLFFHLPSLAQMVRILATDTFVRNNQTSWGNASDGETYTEVGTGTPSISSDTGLLVSPNIDTNMHLGIQTASDQDIVCQITCSSINDIAGVEGRFSGTVGSSLSSVSCYKLLYYTSSINLNKTINGANSNLATTSFTLTAGTAYWFHLRIVRSTLYGNVWPVGKSEPSGYMLTASDTSVTQGGFALLANTATGSTGVSFAQLTVATILVTDTLIARLVLKSQIINLGIISRLVFYAAQTRGWGTRLRMQTTRVSSLLTRIILGFPPVQRVILFLVQLRTARSLGSRLRLQLPALLGFPVAPAPLPAAQTFYGIAGTVLPLDPRLLPFSYQLAGMVLDTPVLATAPIDTGTTVSSGATFTLFFLNPSSTTQNALSVAQVAPINQLPTMTFALSTGEMTTGVVQIAVDTVSYPVATPPASLPLNLFPPASPAVSSALVSQLYPYVLRAFGGTLLNIEALGTPESQVQEVYAALNTQADTSGPPFILWNVTCTLMVQTTMNRWVVQSQFA